MAANAHIETHLGREVLVRTGCGQVVEVRGDGPPVGDGWSRYRVTIRITPTNGMQRAVGVAITGVVRAGDPLLDAACAAVDSKGSVRWTVNYHRRPHVPANVPITDLDHRVDVIGWLTGCEALESSATPIAQAARRMVTWW